jgi:hypothetical protein
MPVIFMYAEVFLADALCFCMSPGRYPISIPCHTLQIAPPALKSRLNSGAYAWLFFERSFLGTPLRPGYPFLPSPMHHVYPLLFPDDCTSSFPRALWAPMHVRWHFHGVCQAVCGRCVGQWVAWHVWRWWVLGCVGFAGCGGLR